MTAAWWRDYRRRRGAELREYNRARRHAPEARAQRHAQEARRRVRIRAATPADVPMVHPLLDVAGALVPLPAPGSIYRFRRELTAEDARSEAVLALIEGRDPRAAVRAYQSAERAWELRTRPMPEEMAA